MKELLTPLLLMGYLAFEFYKEYYQEEILQKSFARLSPYHPLMFISEMEKLQAKITFLGMLIFSRNFSPKYIHWSVIQAVLVLCIYFMISLATDHPKFNALRFAMQFQLPVAILFDYKLGKKSQRRWKWLAAAIALAGTFVMLQEPELDLINSPFWFSGFWISALTVIVYLLTEKMYTSLRLTFWDVQFRQSLLISVFLYHFLQKDSDRSQKLSG